MDAHNRGSQRYEMISIYASGPCDPKPEASNCCKNPVSDSFFQPVHLYDITGDLLNMAALPTDLWDSCGMHASTARLDAHMLF